MLITIAQIRFGRTTTPAIGIERGIDVDQCARRIVDRLKQWKIVAAGDTLGGVAAINLTRRVLAVVGGSHGEMRVPEQLIGELRARENASGFIEISANSFRPGQKVRIVAGPFAGVTAMFAESSDERRVTILIELLGKSHLVSAYSSALDIIT